MSDESRDDLVLHRIEDGVLVISWNRPEKHNAYHDESVRQWWAAFSEGIENPDVRVVLLRGEGKSFSSGRDTTVLGQRKPGDTDYDFIVRAQHRALTRLSTGKPIVAALKGAVLGGGLEMALTADIRVAATDVKLGLPEILHGLVTDTGGVTLATKLAGASRAKYLAMTGDRIGADRAYEWGLVDFVVEPEELDGYALDLAKRIAAKSPIPLAMIKEIAELSESGSVRAGYHGELLAQTALFASKTIDKLTQQAD